MVQSAFEIVVFAVVAIVLVVGTIAMIASRGSVYDEIGRGSLMLDSDHPRAPTGATTPAQAEEEIRQMLTAQNERRVRRGQEPLDLEAEVARLTAPAVVNDAGLVDEVRQLVIARNERRARQGKEPLDVEAEVARQLRELGA